MKYKKIFSTLMLTLTTMISAPSFSNDDDQEIFLGQIDLTNVPGGESSVIYDEDKIEKLNALTASIPTPTKGDWKLTPQELRNKPWYNDVFKDHKDCDLLEVQMNAKSWAEHGCDAVLADAIKKAKEEHEAETKNKWKEKYNNLVKDLDKYSLSDEATKLINNQLNKILSSQSETGQYYGKGVESVRMPFYLANMNNPFTPSSTDTCKSSLISIETHQNTILKDATAIDDLEDSRRDIIRKITKENVVSDPGNLNEFSFKIPVDDINNEILNNEAYKFYTEEIDKLSKQLNDPSGPISELKIAQEQFNNNCTYNPNFKVDPWLAIGYTDGSLLVYKTDDKPESPLYGQPIVSNPEECLKRLNDNYSDESIEISACQIEPRSIHYYPAKDMLSNTYDGEHLTITSLVAAQAIDNEKHPVSNKIDLVVGYGVDKVVARKNSVNTSIKNPLKTTVSFSKETTRKGGAIVAVSISANNEGIDKQSINPITQVEDIYGIKEMYIKYKKEGLKTLNRYLVIRKEGQTSSFDSYDAQVSIKKVGDIPMPIPNIGLLKVMSRALGYSKEKITNYIKYQATSDNFIVNNKHEEDKSVYDLALPNNLNIEDTSTSVFNENIGLFLGFKSGEVLVATGDNQENSQIKFKDVFEYFNLSKPDIYKTDDFNIKCSEDNNRCNQQINFIYPVTDQNILLFGTGNDLFFIKFKNEYNLDNTVEKKVIAYGGYNLKAHNEFIFNNSFSPIVNLFTWENRIFLVLDSGKIVSVQYNANKFFGDEFTAGDNFETINNSLLKNLLIFDDSFEINNPSNPKAQSIRQALKSSTEVVFSESGKVVAFAASEPNSINIFSTKLPGLKGDINGLYLGALPQGDIHQEYLNIENLTHLYFGAESNNYKNNNKHPATDIKFNYDDPERPLIPTDLTFKLGKASSSNNGFDAFNIYGAIFKLTLQISDSEKLYVYYDPELLTEQYICNDNGVDNSQGNEASDANRRVEVFCQVPKNEIKLLTPIN